MNMQGWDVLINGRRVNIVYYASDCEADYVYRSLVEHDGYPSHITVRRRF